VPEQENPGSLYVQTVLALKLEQSEGIVAVIELYVATPGPKSVVRVPVRLRELALKVPVATPPAPATVIELTFCVISTVYPSVPLHSEVADVKVSKMLQPPLISPIGASTGALLSLSLLHDVIINIANTTNTAFDILFISSSPLFISFR
jgi:hypothetical protein